jgi:hypothetical protein
MTERDVLVRIGQVKALAASIRKGVPGAEHQPLRKVLDDRLLSTATTDVEWRRENADLLIEAKLLDVIIKAELLKPRDSDERRDSESDERECRRPSAGAQKAR